MSAPAEFGLRRAWARFRTRRLGTWSLWLFTLLFGLSLLAPVLCTDQPLVVRYDGHLYFPVLHTDPETTFGGDFHTPADFHDPFIRAKVAAPGNFAVFAPIPWSPDGIDEYATRPFPSSPSARHWLGTDDRGRDVLARLIYGFRLSVLFALALTVTGTALGILMGAVQGYFGGRLDLTVQRLLEIWGSMPELYLLIIFSAVFAPGLALLLVLLSLFGWMGLADYVRAEFLRNRQMDYVRAVQALGQTDWRIMWRHVLPNSMTPVITFLPFRMSAAILALTSLDFLGLGVPPPTPSLGELLAQGKANLDAWWLSAAAFGALVLTLLLLTFIGEALRDALDPRHTVTPVVPDAAPAGGGPA